MTAERHLPAPGPGQVPAHLEKLVETAKDYARGELRCAHAYPAAACGQLDGAQRL